MCSQKPQKAEVFRERDVRHKDLTYAELLSKQPAYAPQFPDFSAYLGPKRLKVLPLGAADCCTRGQGGTVACRCHDFFEISGEAGGGMRAFADYLEGADISMNAKHSPRNGSHKHV